MKGTLLSISAALLVLTAACDRNENSLFQELLNECQNKTKSLYLSSTTIGIPADIKDLDSSQAEIVAQIYLNKARTRSSSRNIPNAESIKSIIPIRTENRELAIYAVNFNGGGYILVSASTEFYPILAEIETGEYNPEEINDAASTYIADLAHKVILAKEGKLNINTEPQWIPYIGIPEAKYITRSSNAFSDEYYDAYYEFIDSQDYGNYRIYKLKNCSDILPSNIYQEFIQAAQSEDLWEGTQYSWENTAYVVERTTESLVQIGPLLKTEWGQLYKYYNSNSKSTPTGCVTIATGQLMRFFQYPASFAWNSMPNSTSYLYNAQDTNNNPYVNNNDPLDSFLQILHNKLDVSDSGSSTIDKAEKVLKSYGYSVSKQNHETSKIISSLKYNRKPVYARGAKGFLRDGHAWVIDGLYAYTCEVRYTLYRLSDRSYPDFRYDNAENANPYIIFNDLYTFHMNWGWDGQGNGWFLDDDITVTVGSEKYNFYYDRQELILNIP